MCVNLRSGWRRFFVFLLLFIVVTGCNKSESPLNLLVTTDHDEYVLDEGMTLRQAIDEARASNHASEIRFEPRIKTINLQKSLHLPSGISIMGRTRLDGGHEPRIVFEGKGSVFYLDGVQDVSIARLQITQNSGSSPLGGDCVSVRDGATRIQIENLHVEACHDGLIDVTTTGTELMDIIIENVVFRNHDKVMLVSAPVGIQSFCEPPIINLTVRSAHFIGTGQRHPRVSGRVLVKLQDSRVDYAPFQRPDGVGAAYGVYADNGGSVIISNTHINPLNQSVKRKDWSHSDDRCTSIIRRGHKSKAL